MENKSEVTRIKINPLVERVSKTFKVSKDDLIVLGAETMAKRNKAVMVKQKAINKAKENLFKHCLEIGELVDKPIAEVNVAIKKANRLSNQYQEKLKDMEV